MITDGRPATNVSPGAYLTITVAGQLFGLPVPHVHDVFVPERLTRIPCASGAVAGLVNLRGRIVTAIDLRSRFGLRASGDAAARMAVGVDWDGESYGLLVDSVGDVIALSEAVLDPNPVNLDPRLAVFSRGVHRLEGQLLLVLEVECVLDIGVESAAA